LLACGGGKIRFRAARQHFNKNLGGTRIKHVQPFGGGPRNIEYPVAYSRPPVVHPNGYLLVVNKIGNDKHRTKGQFWMRRRKIVRVKKLAGGGRTSLEFGSVPRSRAFLPEAGVFQRVLGRQSGTAQ
jgi:hypothetical protein